jgi:hypothetical protein
MRKQSGVTSEERTLAALGHGLTFVEGGIIGPLVLYIVKRDESPFVAFHALQSLYFGLGFLIVIMICFVIMFVTLGFAVFLLLPFLMFLSLAYMVFEIIAAIKAYNCEWYQLPIAGAMARAAHPPE